MVAIEKKGKITIEIWRGWRGSNPRPLASEAQNRPIIYHISSHFPPHLAQIWHTIATTQSVCLQCQQSENVPASTAKLVTTSRFANVDTQRRPAHFRIERPLKDGQRT